MPTRGLWHSTGRSPLSATKTAALLTEHSHTQLAPDQFRQPMKLPALLVCLACATSQASELELLIRPHAGEPLPARIHLSDQSGKHHHPPAAPFWRGGFICDGSASLELPAGDYQYEIERGPEWAPQTGTVTISNKPVIKTVTLTRIADLKPEGYFAADLHVHRAPQELPLHLQAEDLSIASVQTWWNQSNPWEKFSPPQPVKTNGGERFYHILSGEDERGGGALLYHCSAETIDITGASREWPISTVFLDQAAELGFWPEIEKPFWWDTPLWLASGKVRSVGIAHNHMHRAGVLDSEAWGRPRDLQRYPGVHGNGLYTQDLYYRILNTGHRLPPSAGSASGVLPNPVGYNRVYVHTGGQELTWDRWWKNFAAGRCFVTNGRLLRLTAAGEHPGHVFKSDGPLTLTIAGRLDSNSPVDRIELVQNGQIRPVELPITITIDRSGWFLVRAIAKVPHTFRFASTAPWYAEIDQKPMPPAAEDAQFFSDWLTQRRATLRDALTEPGQVESLEEIFAPALGYWHALASPAE